MTTKSTTDKSTPTPDIHKCFLGLSKAQVAELNARQDRNTANTISILEIHHPTGGIVSPESSTVPCSDKIRIQMEQGYYIIKKTELIGLNINVIKQKFSGLQCNRDFGSLIRFYPVY